MMRAHRWVVVLGSSLVVLAAFGHEARADEPPVTRLRSGPHIIPYVGVSSFQGSTGKALDPGWRAGGLGGVHVNEMISVNGEVTLDFLNFGGGGDVSGMEVDLALSPFVHLPAGNVELVFGPKLGAWFGADRTSVGSGDANVTTKDSLRGWLAGVNAGAFLPLTGSVAIGGLLSFAVRSPTNVCTTTNIGAEACQGNNLPDANKVLAFTLALLL